MEVDFGTVLKSTGSRNVIKIKIKKLTNVSFATTFRVGNIPLGID